MASVPFVWGQRTHTAGHRFHRKNDEVRSKGQTNGKRAFAGRVFQTLRPRSISMGSFEQDVVALSLFLFCTRTHVMLSPEIIIARVAEGLA